MKAQHALMAAFVVLLPFQDTILRATPLRMLGQSFAVIPLFGLVGLDLAVWLASGKKRVNLAVAAALLYGAFITGLYLALWGTSWWGVSLVEKTFNLSVVTCLALYVVFGLPWDRFPYLRLSVYTALTIAVCGVFLNDLNLLGLRPFVANPVFHYTPNPDERWHGLCPEASVLSLCIGSFGLLSAALAPSKLGRIGFLGGTALLLALSGSKGAVLTLAVAVAASGVLARGYRWKALACGLLLSPAIYLGYQRLVQMTSSQAVLESTTFATRGSMLVWAVKVIMRHPWGVGFGGFFPAMTRHLPASMDTVSRWSPLPLDFDEVRSYISSPQFAGTKTLVFDLGVYFGIPFLVAFVVFVVRICRGCLRRGDILLLISVLFVTAAVCTYAGSLFRHDYLVTYAVAWGRRRHGAPGLPDASAG